MFVVAVAAASLAVVTSAGGVGTRSAAATSYCSASRSVDDYHGHQAAHLAPLLERVARAAPAEIGPVVATMRRTAPTAPAFAAARAVWSRYNTNHCCTCIGGPSVPQVVSTAP